MGVIVTNIVPVTSAVPATDGISVTGVLLVTGVTLLISVVPIMNAVPVMGVVGVLLFFMCHKSVGTYSNVCTKTRHMALNHCVCKEFLTTSYLILSG